MTVLMTVHCASEAVVRLRTTVCRWRDSRRQRDSRERDAQVFRVASVYSAQRVQRPTGPLVPGMPVRGLVDLCPCELNLVYLRRSGSS